MPDPPLVTAIIPVFNREAFIRRAVESVLGQTHRPLELVIIDDASTDGTAKELKRIAAEIRKRSEKGLSLKILRRKRNGGVAAARNNAIHAARGELIALLDSDDEWLAGKTARQVELHLAEPDLLVSQTGENWVRRGQPVAFPGKFAKTAGDLFEVSLERCAISPSAVMMRRDLFDQVGLFDESYPACEDYELWLRVASRFRVGLVPEPLVVKYGGHADQLSATVEALDRHRIRAIVKLLESGALGPAQRTQAVAALRKKCRIYAIGCRKRGRLDEAGEVVALPERYA